MNCKVIAGCAGSPPSLKSSAPYQTQLEVICTKKKSYLYDLSSATTAESPK